MKAASLLFASAFLGVLRCTAADVPAPPDFLYAIREVESGDRYDSPPGKAGELGAYQFKFSVWHQHTTAPFWMAETRYADEVAAAHYVWIAHRLQSNGVAPTDWNVAAAWNSGVRAVLTGRLSAPTRDYATRVINLIESESSQRLSLRLALPIALNRRG